MVTHPIINPASNWREQTRTGVSLKRKQNLAKNLKKTIKINTIKYNKKNCQVEEKTATMFALVCGVESDHLENIPPKISISPLATTTECNEVAGGEPRVTAGVFQEHEKCDRIVLQSRINACMGKKPSRPVTLISSEDKVCP